MGITLKYRPSESLEAGVKAQIMEETTRLAASEPWWCEPLNFADFTSLGFIGITKVFLPAYSGPDGYVEVDRDDDFLMAWRDCQIIVKILAEWSRRFGIQWDLSLDEEEIGTIDSTGALSRKLQSRLDDLRRLSNFAETGEALERRISEIDVKYASRCE